MSPVWRASQNKTANSYVIEILNGVGQKRNEAQINRASAAPAARPQPTLSFVTATALLEGTTDGISDTLRFRAPRE